MRAKCIVSTIPQKLGRELTRCSNNSPGPKKVAINLRGLEADLPKTTFPYHSSGSNEKINLVVRNKYKIQKKFLSYDFDHAWIRIFLLKSNNLSD